MEGSKKIGQILKISRQTRHRMLTTVTANVHFISDSIQRTVGLVYPLGDWPFWIKFPRLSSVSLIWYDMIWYDMIRYDMIWYDMIWYDMIWYDMIWYDIFNCNWVATRWQYYVQYTYTQTTQRTTHKQTIHRTTQKLGSVRAFRPVLRQCLNGRHCFILHSFPDFPLTVTLYHSTLKTVNW